jgi:hypothetical protein
MIITQIILDKNYKHVEQITWATTFVIKLIIKSSDLFQRIKKYKKNKGDKMADPAKFKSVSLSIETYQILNWLRKGKITDAELTMSKTIESLVKNKAKKWIAANELNNEQNFEFKNVGQELTKPTSNLTINKI